MKYEGIGFNGPHLANFRLDKFKEEIKHTGLSDDQICELHTLIRLKYGNDQKPSGQLGEAGYADSDKKEPGNDAAELPRTTEGAAARGLRSGRKKDRGNGTV